MDRVTKTVKHEIKKQDGRFLRASLAPLVASIKQTVISSVVKGISGRGVRTYCKFIWIKFLVPLHPLSNIKITNYFNYKPRSNDVFSRNNLRRMNDGA